MLVIDPSDKLPVTSKTGIRTALYSRQPFVAQGVAAVFADTADLEFVASCDCLPAALDSLRCIQPDVLVVHAGSGISLAEVRELRSTGSNCRMVLWGDNIAGEFAFQAIQSGVRGIVPETAPLNTFLDAVRKVHRGKLSFEDHLLQSMLSRNRVTLTARQAQIIGLVAQGLKNKQIAHAMGITEGTVKVYLYKLFKKLGMRDRLEMALFGCRNLFSGHPGLQNQRGCLAPGEQASLLLVTCNPGATVIH